MAQDSVVYFIRAVGTEFVKIGITGKLSAEQRLSTLQVGCPLLLAIEATVPGDAGLERSLHARLRARAVRGEWFRLSAADVEGLVLEIPGILEWRAEIRRRLLAREGLAAGEIEAHAPPRPTDAEVESLVRRSLSEWMIGRAFALRRLGVASAVADEVESLAARITGRP